MFMSVVEHVTAMLLGRNAKEAQDRAFASLLLL